MAVLPFNDDDLPARTDRTVDQLSESIREQFEREVSWSPELVEDLRLFILVRHYQGQLPDDIVEEISMLGGESNFASRREYVIELANSTFRAGHVGEIVVQEEIRVGGVAAEIYKNPVYERRMRSSERAGSLHARAKRMAEAAGVEYDPQLEFSTAGNADLHLASYRRSTIRLLKIALAVGAVTVALILAFKFAA